jgi:DNA-binding response OmpR family regulator
MNIHDASSFARTVLLVEPHVPTRIKLRNALAQHGYRVIQAQDGVDALAAGDAAGGPVHVLITELILPDMDGLHLARRFAARSPHSKLLIVSADCQDVYFLHPGMAHRAALLRKPCEPRQLVGKVREMFARARAAGS